MIDLDVFDLASLEAFTSGLVAAGYEPVPDSGRVLWRGPIHPAFSGLTSATHMRIALRDGWPFIFPVIFVDGLHTNHVTEQGYVCLWREGDGSGDWQTVDGFFGRIPQWCDQAKNGWDSRGLAQDAYLNFTNKHPAVATFDLDALNADHAGAWGTFHAAVRFPWHVELRPARGLRPHLAGLWFHVGSVEVPPRNFAELKTALNRAQVKGLNRAVAKRRKPDALEHSDGLDLILFRWDRDQIRHLLALALTGIGDDVDATVLQEGPNDNHSLMLRAGPDALKLADRSVVVFGLGALGGYAALCLASSGVGRLRLVDPDQILPGNAVRHVTGHPAIGVPKVHAVGVRISEHAPWTNVESVLEHPRTPSRFRELVEDVDLVVDATGSEAVTGSLATIAATAGKPLVSGGLFRGGAIGRVRRQGTAGDTAINGRRGDDRYRVIPPGTDETDLVEPAVGCSAPVNNAPPASVLACSALITQMALDILSDRLELPDELTDVYRGLVGEPPYDRAGRVA